MKIFDKQNEKRIFLKFHHICIDSQFLVTGQQTPNIGSSRFLLPSTVPTLSPAPLAFHSIHGVCTMTRNWDGKREGPDGWAL